jgi:fucose 4-O-acetylase-like acetyltransferase
MTRSVAAVPAQATVSPTYASYEAVRGILILVVIFDHNDIIRNVRSVQDWFLPMTFHVAGFLLLPFLIPPRRLSFEMIRDHAFRYLIPFIFAVVGYAILFQTIVVGRLPGLSWLQNLLTAILLAAPWSLREATGFIVLWFLPALLSTVLLSALFNSSSGRWRAAILLVSIAVHLLVGFAPISVKASVPQGVLIALYIFPLGVAARYLIPRLIDGKKAVLMVPVLIGLVAAGWALERGREVEVATLLVPTITQPIYVIATDLQDLGALAILLACGPLLVRVPGLTLLGRHSLLVYLLHPVFYKAIFLVLLPYYSVTQFATDGDILHYLMGASLSVISVTSLSLLAAIAIHRTRLRSLITPRNFYDWLPITLFWPAQSRRA